MKLHICLRQSRQISIGQRILKFLYCLAKLLYLLIGNPFAGKTYRQFFQSQPHFQNVIHILFCDLRHLRSLPWDHDHQPFQFQHTNRLANWRSAHPQTVRKSNFHQPFSRFQLPPENRLAQSIKYHVPQRQIFIHIHMKITCHRVFLHD